MAVLDHPVSEKVRQAADARWGCWNRPAFARGYMAPDGHYPDGRVRFTYIDHTMSTECRNDVSLTDPKCNGCKHVGTGEDYAQFVRSNAK